ncbi:MAG: glutamate racemase [Treponema sp.]|nr:glutamate racemase [Treponema sp.]
MNNKKPVLFIDSGIGGLPYCVDFCKNNPHEEACYLADTANFPYGPRSKEDLSSILTSLTEKLLKIIDPKIIVLACNTATISALARLRERFPSIPFVGTVPALKPASKNTSDKKIGILGTERTIGEIRGLNLTEDTCEIIGIAAPELVEFVEHQIDKADEKTKNEIVKKYIDLFCAENAGSIVLGCTHFLFLLEEFRSEASNPARSKKIDVYDSLEGITKRIEFLLDENNGLLRANDGNKPVHRIILTGDKLQLTQSALLNWETRARTLGFELNLLNEI